ncbi:hypothetical protein MAPG_00272 [Magnaporthiopsis poae ATCC 64411]|uniref:Zn(2)-C6 fungal-type domain-containing protein n=1 Tax=Magnaporthiopsis poae (strain ATCC 64411 / 73-15) TaxID=644358 RepID=A0A0C4DKJ7_MAGP6|nr:hypothetical protein MAPG_00272 [Magnaporthiopsis poae ATCC 64411]
MDLNQYTTCFPSSGSPKTTCRQCRLRKVRCDGRQDGCGNCMRLNFTCSLAATSIADLDLQEDSTEELVVQLRPKRRRGSRACTACRKMKVRCSGTLPHCATCERRGIACQYPTLKRQAAPGSAQTIGIVSARRPSVHVSAPASAFPPDGVDGQVPDSPLENDSPLLNQHIPHLVDRFFARSYPLPCFSFLHPASTKEHAKQGRLDKALAFAICGIAALHSNQGLRTRREDSAIWARMAEQLIWQHLEAPSLPRLQGLLLLINYFMETGSFHKAFMFASLASRAAITLGLNHERPELDFVSQEARRRTMWSLRLTDRYFSLGLTEFELFPLDNIYIQSPGYESAFGDSQLASPSTRAAPETDDFGAYSLFVRLETVRREIMRLTRRITTLADEPQKLASRTKELSGQLADIASQMPMPPALTSSRISTLLQNPWLPRHIAFNLSWHQCHCDLHRLVLAGYSRAVPVPALAQLDEHHKSNAARLCLEHAMAITKTLSDLYQLSVSPPLLEYDTALCAYHAIRLTLDMCGSRQHNLTDHSSIAPDTAIRQAELALAALKRLFPSSPLVGPIIDDIGRLMSSRESSLPSSSPTLSLRGESFEGSVAKDAKVVEEEKNQSPDASAKLKHSEEHVSWAERTRQKLAIHSLLRQNNVSDDEESGDDGFDTDVADRASRPTRSSGAFSVTTHASSITRNVMPTDYAAARPGSPRSPISSRRKTAEANQPAERYQKPFGIPSPGDEAQTGQDGSFEFEIDGSQHDRLNGPNRRLQFPLFPWFGGTGTDRLLVL